MLNQKPVRAVVDKDVIWCRAVVLPEGLMRFASMSTNSCDPNGRDGAPAKPLPLPNEN